MQLLLVQGLGSLLALLLFVWIASPDHNPVGTIVGAWRAAWATRAGRRAIAAIGVVVALNYVEGAWDPNLTRWLGWNATPLVHAIEGDLVGRVQATTPRWLVVALALVYVPGFLAMLTAPLAVWRAPQDRVVAGRYVVAFVLNYVVALPFFLLLPVQEVGYSGLSSARPLLNSVWPGITAQLHVGSPVDNCFPSMHVSCVVTALWYAHAHGPNRLRGLAWAVAPATAWSTMVLGIHWVSDAIAGALVGIGCCLVANRTLMARTSERPA
jgi:membrane-associated phospholipid phosphatase